MYYRIHIKINYFNPPLSIVKRETEGVHIQIFLKVWMGMFLSHSLYLLGKFYWIGLKSYSVACATKVSTYAMIHPLTQRFLFHTLVLFLFFVFFPMKSTGEAFSFVFKHGFDEKHKVYINLHSCIVKTTSNQIWGREV